MSISLHESISFTILADSAEYVLPELKATDQGIKKYAKLTVQSAAFAVLSIATLVEAVVRTALTLVAKLFVFFVPKQWAETLDEKVTALSATSLKNFGMGFISAYQVVGNFLSEETSEKIGKCLTNNLPTEIFGKAVGAFNTIHINGFSSLGTSQ